MNPLAEMVILFLNTFGGMENLNEKFVTQRLLTITDHLWDTELIAVYKDPEGRWNYGIVKAYDSAHFLLDGDIITRRWTCALRQPDSAKNIDPPPPSPNSIRGLENRNKELTFALRTLLDKGDFTNDYFTDNGYIGTCRFCGADVFNDELHDNDCRLVNIRKLVGWVIE